MRAGNQSRNPSRPSASATSRRHGERASAKKSISDQALRCVVGAGNLNKMDAPALIFWAARKSKPERPFAEKQSKGGKNSARGQSPGLAAVDPWRFDPLTPLAAGPARPTAGRRRGDHGWRAPRSSAALAPSWHGLHRGCQFFSSQNRVSSPWCGTMWSTTAAARTRPCRSQ